MLMLMTFDDVELRHLRSLRAVAEEGSFIGAADVLGFSQAAISQQIAGLERAVGQPMFDRPGGPRPVTLTPAGRLMLEHAESIAAQLRQAEDDLVDLSSGTAGRLRIGTYQSVSVQLLPEVVQELRATAPDLSISLVEHVLNESLVEDLLDGIIDVTFLAGPFEDSRLELIDLGFDPFVVLLQAGSDLARAHPGKTFPTKALIDVPMVGQDSPDRRRDMIEGGLRAHGVRPRYVFQSNDNGAMQGMVRAGMGPAVMPLLAVETRDPGIVVKRLDPPLEPRTILIALPLGSTPMPAAQRFVKVAKKECRRRLALAR
jgi:DNA-binding transcriptional LysR family regulator